MSITLAVKTPISRISIPERLTPASVTRVLATGVGDLDGVPSLQLQPSMTLVSVGIWGVKQQRRVILHLSLFLGLSHK